MSKNILIKNTTVYVGTSFDKKESVDILIESGKINKIGPSLKDPDATIIDGKNFFITPGFINSHFHPSQQLNRALGVGFTFDQQIDLLHFSDNVRKPDDKECLSYIAVLEALKAGTTCFQSVGGEIESQVNVYENMGIRAACVMIPKDIAAANDKTHAVRAKSDDTQALLKRAEENHKKFHNNLRRIHFGAVNVRYCSDELILGMLKLAEKYDVGFHMHVAESQEYVDSVMERTGDRPLEHLYKIGALNPHLSIAHSVQITQKEIEYIAKTGVHVVHCPRANSYTYVGVCPVTELIKSGVNVCLGSDAAINNNSNEVRGEAEAAFTKIADKNQSPEILPYKELFRMLTVNGAKAIGLENKIGSIEVGKFADLVLWDKNDLPFIPGFNHIADLLFTDSCRAHTVIIDGNVVLENYKTKTVDEEALKQKAREVIARYHKAFKEKAKGVIQDE
jgi:5-methylthioadenosine/S-adenosylhomocysteine deaminase